MDINECQSISITSRDYWNNTGIILQEGFTYDFKAEGIWTDWFIQCNADGFSKWYRGLLGRYKRSKHDNWFALMGCINKENIFLIGTEKKEFMAPMTGELFCFANDISWAYRNNKGSLTLTITRIK